MKAQRIELCFISGGQTLKRASTVKFIEWIAGPLHAAVKEIAGIRSPAIVGQLRIAAVHGKIGSWGGRAARAQPRAGARKAKQVEDIGCRAIGNAAHCMGQLMKRNTD